MSFLDKVKNRIFPSPMIYVRLLKNEVEVLNVSTGVEIKRKAKSMFSNDRLLIADFRVFESFFKEVVVEVLNNKSKLINNLSFRVLVQQVNSDIKEVTPVETRVYQDSFFHCGAKEILIDKSKSQKRYSNNQIIEMFNSSFDKL